MDILLEQSISVDLQLRMAWTSRYICYLSTVPPLFLRSACRRSLPRSIFHSKTSPKIFLHYSEPMFQDRGTCCSWIRLNNCSISSRVGWNFGNQTLWPARNNFYCEVALVHCTDPCPSPRCKFLHLGPSVSHIHVSGHFSSLLHKLHYCCSESVLFHAGRLRFFLPRTSRLQGGQNFLLARMWYWKKIETETLTFPGGTGWLWPNFSPWPTETNYRLR